MRNNTVDTFFKNFYNTLYKNLNCLEKDQLSEVANSIIKTHEKNGKIIVVGNGGSAAIASHVSVDLTKSANIKSITFNESSLLTCFSNDFGYEHWVEKAIDIYAEEKDLIILISSSGNSKNIINGAKKAVSRKIPLITLSGFESKNELKQLGNINLWLDSKVYNIIENVHQVWLLSVIDFIIDKKLGIET
jgi:D-sedoheptulose 7-phosphate isomerase